MVRMSSTIPGPTRSCSGRSIGAPNFDAVKDQVPKAMSDDGESQKAIDNLRPLKAFGITAEVDGHYENVTVRLSVDD